ncbi:hypothetical protein [Halalkalibacter oceani]|uniref:hypothetical protein n=1 Tax=Halalkalibacter oceani TaxID=1653776 RepID=UPI0033984F33
MTTFLIVLTIIFTRFLYKRYVPVLGLSCVELEKINDQDHTIILDVRDSSIVYKSRVAGAVNIPLAYLKKNYYLFEGNSIYIIGSEMIDVNVSASFLKNKGAKVKGYYLYNNKQPTRFNCRKRREIHGVQ